MSHDIATLLMRNLLDVFGEGDAARRRAVVDEIFHEDAVFVEPHGIYRGRDEISRIAGVIRATHRRFDIRPSLRPRSCMGWPDGCSGLPAIPASRLPMRAPISSWPVTDGLLPSICSSTENQIRRARRSWRDRLSKPSPDMSASGDVLTRSL
ncbi:hypothetical protein J2Y63_000073 [Shinella sp. BE166]|uniref:nuclear transport factor 2 family protein n=1 Tax=Shinella sp. BE166 TaxID=3373918 RepID=UPI003EBAFE38